MGREIQSFLTHLFIMIHSYFAAFVDLSYILQRNLYACSKGRNPGDYNAGDVIRSIIQTLNKIPRDFGINISKYILVADAYSPEHQGYYRHWLLKGSYKTSRKWMTEDMYKEIKENPNSTEKDIQKAEAELYLNEVKQEAKRILKTELKNFGVPCIWQPGWEYDDCAYLFSCLWYGIPDPRKCLIITKDSDLEYSINPKVDYFKIPSYGKEPEIITYDQKYLTVPQEIRDRGVSLYQYKSMLDSLGISHNDMRKTKSLKANTTQCILKILDGDYSLVADEELFKRQLSTFDISSFPGLEEIKTRFLNNAFTMGRLSDLEAFKEFCSAHDITGISDTYYLNFISRFDQKLFTE